MKRLLTLLAMLTLTTNALVTHALADERVVREFHHEDFDDGIVIPTGEDNRYGETIDGMRNYRGGGANQDRAVIHVVESPKNASRTVAIFTLDNPGVTQSNYSVLGDIEYANVEGKAYLEMRNDFPDGGHYFSRTLGDSGPMMAISGNSAKRPFMLPFAANPGMTPRKLTLNVVMPGKGKVTLSRLRLIENGPPATLPAPANVSAEAKPNSPEQAESMRVAWQKEYDRLLERQTEIKYQLEGITRSLGAGNPQVRNLRAMSEQLDKRIAELRSSLKVPPAAPATTMPSGDEWARILTAQDVVRTVAGINAFTYLAEDPTGMRQVIVREYDRPGDAFPAEIKGTFRWQGMTKWPAKIGYFYDDANGVRQMNKAMVAKTRGTNGSAEFTLKVNDTAVRHITVAVLSPGPGRVEIDLPASLGASMSAAAFVPTVPWSFAKWVGGHVWVLACALMVWTFLGQGHGRRSAYALGAASAVGGVFELFLAGVVAGLGRPTEAWVMLIAGAAILIGIAAVLLPRIDRRFSTAELRKMRAMDVPA